MSNSFALEPGERPFEALGPDSYRSRRQFMDFVIDGAPLQAMLLRSRRGPLADDLVPVLVADWPIDQDLETLLGRTPSELVDGRVPIYVCPECGDLGCGGVTAVVDWAVDSVVWRDLVFQNNYEPFEDDERFDDVGPFTFDRLEYEATLEDVRAGLAARAAERRAAAEREQVDRRWFPFRLFGPRR